MVLKLVVYHGKCPDGSTAAAVFLRAARANGDGTDTVVLCGHSHGKDFVEEAKAALDEAPALGPADAGLKRDRDADTTPIEVTFLDVTLFAADVKRLDDAFPGRSVTVKEVVDHHKGAHEMMRTVLEAYPECTARVDSTVAVSEAQASRVTVVEGKVSAALLAWQHYNDDGADAPVWVRGVSAQDTWSFTDEWPQRLCNALYLHLPMNSLTVADLAARLDDAAWPDMAALAAEADTVAKVEGAHGDDLVAHNHIVDLPWVTVSDDDATPVRAAFIPGARPDTGLGIQAALRTPALDEVHVFFFFHYSASSDEWKVSLRGRGVVDLTRVANAAKGKWDGVTGGGHAGAAGLSFGAFHIREMWQTASDGAGAGAGSA